MPRNENRERHRGGSVQNKGGRGADRPQRERGTSRSGTPPPPPAPHSSFSAARAANDNWHVSPPPAPPAHGNVRSPGQSVHTSPPPPPPRRGHGPPQNSRDFMHDQSWGHEQEKPGTYSSASAAQNLRGHQTGRSPRTSQSTASETPPWKDNVQTPRPHTSPASMAGEPADITLDPMARLLKLADITPASSPAPEARDQTPRARKLQAEDWPSLIQPKQSKAHQEPTDQSNQFWVDSTNSRENVRIGCGETSSSSAMPSLRTCPPPPPSPHVTSACDLVSSSKTTSRAPMPPPAPAAFGIDSPLADRPGFIEGTAESSFTHSSSENRGTQQEERTNDKKDSKRKPRALEKLSRRRHSSGQRADIPNSNADTPGGVPPCSSGDMPPPPPSSCREGAGPDPPMPPAAPTRQASKANYDSSAVSMSVGCCPPPPPPPPSAPATAGDGARDGVNMNPTEHQRGVKRSSEDSWWETNQSSWGNQWKSHNRGHHEDSSWRHGTTSGQQTGDGQDLASSCDSRDWEGRGEEHVRANKGEENTDAPWRRQRTSSQAWVGGWDRRQQDLSGQRGTSRGAEGRYDKWKGDGEDDGNDSRDEDSEGSDADAWNHSRNNDRHRMSRRWRDFSMVRSRPKQMKPLSEWFCHVCNKDCKREEKYKQHVEDTHVQCPEPGCTYSAPTFVLQMHALKHVKTSDGQSVCDSPQELAAWVELRKSNFPSRVNLQRKEEKDQRREQLGALPEKPSCELEKLLRRTHGIDRQGYSWGNSWESGDWGSGSGKGKGKWKGKGKGKDKGKGKGKEKGKEKGKKGKSQGKSSDKGWKRSFEDWSQPFDFGHPPEEKHVLTTVLMPSMVANCVPLEAPFAAPAPLPPRPKRLCRFFERGFCFHGESCQYSHDSGVPDGKQDLGPRAPGCAPTGGSRWWVLPSTLANRVSRPGEGPSGFAATGGQPLQPTHVVPCPVPEPRQRRDGLLRRLLRPEVEGYYSTVLQCVRYIVATDFFRLERVPLPPRTQSSQAPARQPANEAAAPDVDPSIETRQEDSHKEDENPGVATEDPYNVGVTDGDAQSDMSDLDALDVEELAEMQL